MTPEQLVAILTAVTALVVALGTVVVQLHTLAAKVDANHVAINGRVGELLTVATMAAAKQGELQGRDWQAAGGKPQ